VGFNVKYVFVIIEVDSGKIIRHASSESPFKPRKVLQTFIETIRVTGLPQDLSFEKFEPNIIEMNVVYMKLLFNT